LTGTGRLFALNLRLDRVRMPVWAASVAGLVLVSAASVMSLYSTPEQIAQYVSLIDISGNMTAVNSALNGPGYGFDHPTVGVILVNEAAIWGAVGFALMGIFQMARHTRAEEEAERTEVLRSRMVGRHAGLAAAAVSVGGLEVAVGLVSFVGLIAMGFGVTGSVALVLAWVAAGVLFASVTAVAAQVASTSRATIGLGVGALGLAYLVRSVGDMGSSWISWLSPVGWVHRVRPFAGERWWVLALSVAVVVVCAGLSVVLSDRRNLGAGLLPQRLGPTQAGPATSRPLGLIARLQKGPLIGWAVGLAVLGFAYGSIASDIEQMFVDNPDLARFIPMGAGSVTDAYLAYTLALMAMMAGGFITSSGLRLRSEESSGVVELVLARPMSRSAWAGDHLLVALVYTAVLLLASGVGAGVGVALAIGDWAQLPRMMAASLALMPVELVLLGLTMLMVGLLPRLALLSWLGLAIVVVVGLFGDLFRLPGWVRSLSPLEQLPMMPADRFDIVEFVAVSVVGAALVVAGLAAYRRRDIPAV
jgi:ABC-2 type transport system permease protein